MLLFRIGTALIGFGGGLFAAGTLTAAMALARDGDSGLALGTWGAVQATAAGGGIALGGGIRDAVSSLAASGALGRALTDPSDGIQRRLPHRNCVVVRHSGCDRPARAHGTHALLAAVNKVRSR